ncbi:MAG: hypothetical protein ACEQSR_00295 [Candidatus Methylacidiphilales bacterium]
MKTSAFLVIIFFPFLAFGQLFNDIKQKENSTYKDHLSKGWMIGICYHFGVIGNLEKLNYTQTNFLGTTDKQTLSSNFNSNFFEVCGFYRYKKIGLGLGINQLSFTAPNSTFGDGAYEVIINNEMKLTGLVAKLFFRQRITKLIGLEFMGNLGVPLKINSSLSNQVSGGLQYGAELNYRLSIYKNLDIKLGFKYTQYDFTFSQFDYKRPNINGNFYDFSMNKGQTNSFGIFGPQIGISYNFNKTIK